MSDDRCQDCGSLWALHGCQRKSLDEARAEVERLQDVANEARDSKVRQALGRVNAMEEVSRLKAQVEELRAAGTDVILALNALNGTGDAYERLSDCAEDLKAALARGDAG